MCGWWKPRQLHADIDYSSVRGAELWRSAGALVDQNNRDSAAVVVARVRVRIGVLDRNGNRAPTSRRGHPLRRRRAGRRCRAASASHQLHANKCTAISAETGHTDHPHCRPAARSPADVWDSERAATRAIAAQPGRLGDRDVSVHVEDRAQAAGRAKCIGDGDGELPELSDVRERTRERKAAELHAAGDIPRRLVCERPDPAGLSAERPADVDAALLDRTVLSAPRHQRNRQVSGNLDGRALGRVLVVRVRSLDGEAECPSTLGTPVTPPSAPSVSPPGNAPPSRDHVYGEAPPLAPRLAEYEMPTSPPAIGMPVMDAGVEACVGLGAGVGVGVGVGGGMLVFCAVVTHVNPQSKTTIKAAASRHNELMPGPALGAGPANR